MALRSCAAVWGSTDWRCNLEAVLTWGARTLSTTAAVGEGGNGGFEERGTRLKEIPAVFAVVAERKRAADDAGCLEVIGSPRAVYGVGVVLLGTRHAFVLLVWAGSCGWTARFRSGLGRSGYTVNCQSGSGQDSTG